MGFLLKKKNAELRESVSFMINKCQLRWFRRVTHICISSAATFQVKLSYLAAALIQRVIGCV